MNIKELAPTFSYKTRKASAVPWKDVPEQNKRLMIAVVEKAMLPEIERLLADEREKVRALALAKVEGQFLGHVCAPDPCEDIACKIYHALRKLDLTAPSSTEEGK